MQHLTKKQFKVIACSTRNLATTLYCIKNIKIFSALKISKKSSLQHTLIMLLLVLAGCSSTTKLSCLEKEATQSKLGTESSLAQTKINIGIDGSGSMTGFVNEAGSNFSKTIDNISALVASKNLINQTSYWRLGRNQKGINSPLKLSDSQFLDARIPVFYCGEQNKNYPCVTSTLDQLLLVPKVNSANRLDVLITDLEPDSGAISNITKGYSRLLKENSSYKVVMLGGKSQFSGYIYPAQNGSFAPFKYSSDASIERTGRPYYILISGPSLAVDEFLSAFYQISHHSLNDLRSSVFAGVDATSDTVTLNKSKSWQSQANSECLNEVISFNRKIPTDIQQWLLGSVKNKCGSKPFELNLVSIQSPRLIGANIQPSFVKIEPTGTPFSPKGISNKNGQLHFTLIANPTQINSILLEPTKIMIMTSALDNALWSNWNSEVSNPQGNKTQNLLLFVSSMQGMTGRDANSSPAVQLCLAVNGSNNPSAQNSKSPVLIFVAIGVLIVTLGVGLALINRNTED